MNREYENIDRSGFTSALNALTSQNIIIAIQKVANEIYNANISIGYSKLKGREYTIYFLIHTQDDITVQSKTDFTAKLSSLLLYDDVTVYTENSISQASLNSNYSPFTLVSSENSESVRKFISDYRHYLGDHRSKSNSPAYDDFIELLRESDTDLQENLLRRLTQDCEDLGFELDFHSKRQKMENK